jgi:thiol-disulfide isomerase/thioredoxin
MAGSRVRRPFAVGLVSMVLAGLIAALAWQVAGDEDDGVPQPTVLTIGDDGGTVPQVELTGEPAPDFAYEQLGTGTEVDFDAFRDGRPALVNFFAEWCVPCVREMPALQDAFEAYGDEVAFLGLSYNESAEDALALIEQTGVTYETGRDPAGDILTAFSAVGMPTTVFIAADGTVTTAHTGEITPDQLTEELEALLT